MNSRGFSIIELIVVIGIISILLTLATINFGAWQRKSMVERYTKELYSDVQDARMRAAFTKRVQRIEFGAQKVVFRSFLNEGDAVGTIVSTKNLPLSFTRNTADVPAPSNFIDFNTRGIMIDPNIQVICFTTTEDAAYDALIITPALTSMGKVTNRGNACARTNVTQK
ncbi:MAG: type II secretion system protein [Desulfuromonadaceae bacterium]|nr:type II secretion system protein [Desulfuromonadaceae bacterium]